MSRLNIPSRDNAPAGTRLGTFPNLYPRLAKRAAALEATLAFGKPPHRTLDLKLRERIVLAVVQANGCDHCVSENASLAANLAKAERRRSGGRVLRPGNRGAHFAALLRDLP